MAWLGAWLWAATELACALALCALLLWGHHDTHAHTQVCKGDEVRVGEEVGPVTREELRQWDGQQTQRTCVALKGLVYDISHNTGLFADGGVLARHRGSDITALVEGQTEGNVAEGIAVQWAAAWLPASGRLVGSLLAVCEPSSLHAADTQCTPPHNEQPQSTQPHQEVGVEAAAHRGVVEEGSNSSADSPLVVSSPSRPHTPVSDGDQDEWELVDLPGRAKL